MPPGGCPGAPAYYGRIWRCPGPAGLYKGGLVLYYGGCLFVLQPALGESPTHFTLFLQQLLLHFPLCPRTRPRRTDLVLPSCPSTTPRGLSDTSLPTSGEFFRDRPATWTDYFGARSALYGARRALRPPDPVLAPTPRKRGERIEASFFGGATTCYKDNTTYRLVLHSV